MTGSGREEEEGHGRARQRGLGLRRASALKGLRAPEPGSRGSEAGEPRGGTLKSTHNPIAEEEWRGTGSALDLGCNSESSVTPFVHPARTLAGARWDGAGEARWEAAELGQRSDGVKPGCS